MGLARFACYRKFPGRLVFKPEALRLESRSKIDPKAPRLLLKIPIVYVSVQNPGFRDACRPLPLQSMAVTAVLAELL